METAQRFFLTTYLLFFINLFPSVFAQSYPYSDPLNSSNWILNTTVSDEFNAETLDKSKWLIQGEDGEYRSNFIGRAPSQFSTLNVRLENNMLKIQNRWEPTFPFANVIKDGYAFGKLNVDDLSFTCPVTTAAVVAKNAFLYGYMEIRCKPADVSITSAFWALGNNAEFDVFEHLGKPSLQKKSKLQTEIWSSIHDWSLPGGPSVWTQRDQLPFRVAGDFHVWGAEWDPNYIKFYVDGQLIRSITKEDVINHPNAIEANSVGWVMDKPLYIWVDSETFYWCGLPSEEDLPADFEIDYIRVWQKEIPVTGISVLPISMTLQQGLSSKISAEILPNYATNKTIHWSSDNTQIATVNTDGIVTGKNMGSAIITASSDDGNLKATCLVTVVNEMSGTSVVYEAEDYTSQKGCILKSQFSGFSGSGYMKYSGNGDWIEWNNVVGNGNTANLKFTYAAGKSNRSCDVFVNGVKVSTLNFINTGSWSTYKTETVSATLNVGNNTIKIISNSDNGGPDLDKMEVVNFTTEIEDVFSPNLIIVHQDWSTKNLMVALPYTSNGFVDIYDINGKSLFRKGFIDSSKIFIKSNEVDLNSGIYFVVISNQNRTVTRKIYLIGN